ncbi:MetQ/NlpA family ABC transporter substrate-binding protein [Citricoccus sp. NR2]|uniref:MetQ/NlpA family ABC transporter substrate-binding protein n=1 Tax=Citricoccus sp. NR2 TaxID=3004095 RepID=UPI0022DE2A23|nr:MetQ/NlpA family ABC transporter substrate-binding protein [Citricoccus sp. NR2]WBL20323.1 MetQ/NlpA family ABC transporter substrate-binding protein [Citricoccus sp. NR2]
MLTSSTRRHARLLSVSGIVLAGALALSACGGDSGAELGTEENPVQLGVVGASEPYWATFEEAVEADGISIDIVDFTEYTQPNPALSEGELDINQFQHIQYLADYNVSAGDDIQPIGATAIYPLGFYSEKYDSIDEIPDGEEVVVPNDSVNRARGLLVLQSAGLITLRDGGNASSNLEDVIAEESRVTVTELDAAVTVTSLPDVAGAIVNNDFINDAGLSPEDALAEDDPNDEAALPYVNIFATKAEDVDNEVLNRLVEIYQTDQAVLDGAQESAGGTAVFLQTPASELQESLTTTEDALRAE